MPKRIILTCTVLLVTLFHSATSHASKIWTGDFETGTLAQWWVEQIVAPDRIRVVSDPARQGKFAARFMVQQGDDPISASGNRNELVANTREKAGSEYFYRWSTLFPANFPNVNKWQLFLQWHQENGGGSPPVEFYAIGDTLRLRVGGLGGKVIWSAPMKRGQWHDFIFHVKWSADAKVGFVELYHNGKLEMPKLYTATMYVNDVNYMKMGLYRDATISQEGVLYHDGMTQATSLTDVMPAVPVAAAAPEGSDAPALADDGTDPNGPLDLPVGSVSSLDPTSPAMAGDGTDVMGGCSSAPGSSGGALPWMAAAMALVLSQLRFTRRAKARAL